MLLIKIDVEKVQLLKYRLYMIIENYGALWLRKDIKHLQIQKSIKNKDL